MREYGSDFEIEYLPDSYFNIIEGKMPYSALTRSGREAIGLAIKGLRPGIALLPAYCCWSMELPFNVAGWSVRYYPLNPDLTVDCRSLIGIINELNPDLVLVMDYFGFAPTSEAVKAIRETGKHITIIEDFTQCLFTLEEKWNDDVDCYVASIRKSLGVPDGGIVLSKRPLEMTALSDSRTSFVNYHLESGVRKQRFDYSADAEEKRLFRELQLNAGAELKSDYHLYKISPEARSILGLTDVSTVKFARRKNYEHLYELLKYNQKFTILFAPGNNNAPFMFIIKTQRRDELQEALARKGVYCQVIWPLSLEAKAQCPVSKDMEETMLAIPIDQRYLYNDIEEIGQRINSI